MSFNRTDSPERKNTLLIFIIPDSGTFVKAFAASIFAILLGMILRGEKMEPIMIVRNLYKIYHQGENEVRALDGVSLTVDKGEFVAIVGRSGSGKSTLMNVLGCLDTPTSGEYILDGGKCRRAFRRPALQHPEPGNWVHFSGVQFGAGVDRSGKCGMPLSYRGIPREERHALAEDALFRVGLKERMRHRPSQMSGGQQQL